MNRQFIWFLTAFFLFSLPVQAKMYKWVDEKGQVHFSDRVPPKYLKKERKVLNEQGVTVKTYDAAETQAQKAERLRAERAQRELEKKAEEQAKRDRVLLDTYTTERDLIAARDARLDAIASQMKLSDSIIDDTRRKLDKTEKKIQQLESAGKKVPKNITDKLAREEKQLSTQQNIAQGHLERQQKVNQQFDGYINRFRELKAEQQRIREEREAKRKELEELELAN